MKCPSIQYVCTFLIAFSIFIVTESRVLANESPNAFILSKLKFDELIKSNNAELVELSNNEMQQRFGYISFYGGKGATKKDNVVIYGYIKTDLILSLVKGGGQAMVASAVEADVVTIDYLGNPTSCRRIVWKREYSNGQWTWERKPTIELSTSKTFSEMPDWAQSQIATIAGFISNFPGDSPVKTNKEFLGQIVNLIGLPPNLTGDALASVIENYLRGVVAEWSSEAISSNKEIDFGMEYQLKEKRVLDQKIKFENEGRNIIQKYN